MFTTRRKLMRNVFAGSLGALVPPSFKGVRAEIRPPSADLTVSEFLLEWAELPDWREIRAATPAPQMHHYVMLAMSRKFVQDYFDKHGEVPTGVHRVQYRCGSDASNDIKTSVCGRSREYDELFTYLGGNQISIRVAPK